MGCMFKCELDAFGAGPPKSLDLRGVGNPGQKRQPYIKSMMISGAVVITVIYTVYICIYYIYMYNNNIYIISYRIQGTPPWYGNPTPWTGGWCWLWWWTIKTTYIQYMSLHPQSLRLNLKIMVSKGISFSRGWFSGFMLNLRGLPIIFCSIHTVKISFRDVSFGWLMFLFIGIMWKLQQTWELLQWNPWTTLFHTFSWYQGFLKWYCWWLNSCTSL